MLLNIFIKTVLGYPQILLLLQLQLDDLGDFGPEAGGVLHHAVDGPADEEAQVAAHGTHQVREAVAGRLNIPESFVFVRSSWSTSNLRLNGPWQHNEDLL